MELVAGLGHLLVTKPAGSLPTPVNPGDGVSVTTWRFGAYGPPTAIVYLDGDANITMTGVKVAGRRNGQWWFVGVLNNGADIAITAGVGYSQRVTVLGIFDELAVYAASVVGGTVSYSFEPAEVQS